MSELGKTAFDKVMNNRQQLVDKILENIEKGYVIQPDLWQRNACRPHNPVSGAVYRGCNAMTLWITEQIKGYKDSRWITFKQAQSKGYKVKKGESGTLCEKWIFDKVVSQKNEETGKEEKVVVKFDKPIPNYFMVFNAEQIDGIEPENIKELSPSETLEKANDVIMSSECPIVEGYNESRAYYIPDKDEIHLPERKYFKDDVSFIDVTLHEMAHSTGAENRLNREIKNFFGTDKYAEEELRAEFASYFLGADLGIKLNDEHLQDHTNYIVSWKKQLVDDSKALFRAIADAEAASQYIISNYEKCIRLKESINVNEIPTKAMNRLKAELNDNQIKNIIDRAEISPQHKKMLSVELEKVKQPELAAQKKIISR